jgi:toxin CcdB
MAQFDVYQNPNPASRKARPFVVVLQSDFTSQTDTVIVAPLAAKEAFHGGARWLHPKVTVGGREFVTASHELAALPRRLLGKTVANLASQRHDFDRAIDVLFTGF